MSNLTRGLVGGVASLGVIGAGVGLYAAQAPEHAATAVVVDDTAGILHEPTLLAAVEEVRFYEPTDVAVFTHRGGEEALTDDRALNDAVLAHARETRTEWLSADEQTWADDLYIYAVDPEGRLVGTYFGDNRAVGDQAQLDIQDATKDDLAAGRWTEAAVRGVEEAADRMNAPFLRTGAGMAVTALGALGTVAAAGSWLGVGLHRARRSRVLRAEGDERMANVVRDYDETELHARLIPEDSRYGGLMLRRFDEFREGFRELTELGNEARSVRPRDYNTKASVGRLTAYRDKARALDRLDDVIADTAALLNLDSRWPEAWESQVAPLRGDLEAVEPMLSEQLAQEARGVPQAQRLREFASGQLVRLDQLRAELERRSLSPDDALDELRTAQDTLSGLLDELAAAVTEAVYDKSSEREAMRKEMAKARRAGRSRPTILTTADPTWTWFTVTAFRSGYDQGTAAVQSSRQSSSGSTSGYSASGGSFSGAGSSSRF